MDTKKDKHLAAAQKFVERGQHEKALAEFGKVVQEDPKDTRTWLKMAELHARRGEVEQATGIYLRTGELYTEQGFFQKAVAVYKNVLKLAPGFVPAHLKLADAFKRLGLISDALQQYEAAAVAFQRAGKIGDALAALRGMVEASPENVVSRIKLAEAASQGGHTDEAVRELAKAAEQLKAQGRSDEYVRVAERLLFHQPANLALARDLAEVYVSKNNAPMAIAKLQPCVKAQPRDPMNLQLLARALEQLDQVAKAVSVWKELAHVCHELGRNAERDTAIRKALALAPNDPEAHAASRRFGVSSGAVVGAAAAMASRSGPIVTPEAKGVSRPVDARLGSGATTGVAPRPAGISAPGMTPAATPAPTDQDVARIMSESEVFVKYGLLDRAVDHLRRVFDFQPHDVPAREKLATVLVQLGRTAEAAVELEQAAVDATALDREQAMRLAERALALDPEARRARALLGVASGGPEATQPPPAAVAEVPLPLSVSDELALAGEDDDDAVDIGDDEVIEASDAEIELPPIVGIEDDLPSPVRHEHDAVTVAVPHPIAAVDLDEDLETPPPTVVNAPSGTGAGRRRPSASFEALGPATPPPTRMADRPSARSPARGVPADWADTLGPVTPPPARVLDEGPVTPPPVLAVEDGPATPPPVLAAEDGPVTPPPARVLDEGPVTPPPILIVDEGPVTPPPVLTVDDAPATPPPEVSLDDNDELILAATPEPITQNDAVVQAALDDDEMGGFDVEETIASKSLVTKLPQGGPSGSMPLVEFDGDTLHTVITEVPGGPSAAGGRRAPPEPVDPELAAEIEQVDFFIEQGMADDARALLQELAERFSGEPILAYKLAQLDELLHPEPIVDLPSAPVVDPTVPEETQGTAPRAIVADGGQADLSTHGDLAIAYKEMGLFDPAIAELRLLMQDPGRAVFALTMIGECEEAKGALAEAVRCYREALMCARVTDGEATLLHFSLGAALERLNEREEALRSYEQVARRDPKFRDVERRIAALGGGARPPREAAR